MPQQKKYGQQRKAGQQCGLLFQQGGGQAADNRPKDKTEDQAVIDLQLWDSFRFPAGKPVEQVFSAAAQISGAHSGDAAVPLDVAEGLHLQGTGKGDNNICHRIQIAHREEGDHHNGAALRQQQGKAPMNLRSP